MKTKIIEQLELSFQSPPPSLPLSPPRSRFCVPSAGFAKEEERPFIRVGFQRIRQAAQRAFNRRRSPSESPEQIWLLESGSPMALQPQPAARRGPEIVRGQSHSAGAAKRRLLLVALWPSANPEVSR